MGFVVSAGDLGNKDRVSGIGKVVPTDFAGLAEVEGMGGLDNQITHLEIVHGWLRPDNRVGKSVDFMADFGRQPGDLIYTGAGSGGGQGGGEEREERGSVGV